jgi:hypothetical protein
MEPDLPRLRGQSGLLLVGLERDALMAIATDAYRAHRAFLTAMGLNLKDKSSGTL